jgi:hypothetical protein
MVMFQENLVKKKFFIPALIIIMLPGCDNINLDLDDISRDLEISIRVIEDLTGGWDEYTEYDVQTVSSTNTTSTESTVGSIEVTSGAADSFIRSDVVGVTANTDVSPYAFAYWLFPSRTDSDSDSDATYGNIRYSELTVEEDIDLRTDADPSQVIGAFALDANDGSHFEEINGTDYFSYIVTDTDDDSDVTFTVQVSEDTTNILSGSIVMYNAVYRIFDADGEFYSGSEGWADFYDDEITFYDEDSISCDIVMEGVSDLDDLDDWTIVILYEDSSGDVYVIK